MTNVYKMKSLLLENYQSMYDKMHGNTKEKARIEKLIEELKVSLMNEDLFIEDWK